MCSAGPQPGAVETKKRLARPVSVPRPPPGSEACREPGRSLRAERGWRDGTWLRPASPRRVRAEGPRGRHRLRTEHVLRTRGQPRRSAGPGRGGGRARAQRQTAPWRVPWSLPPAPMPLRSPRVGSAGHTSECPRRQEHVHPQARQSLVKSWRVGCRPTPRGDGPPRRQGGGSRGRKADTEVRALAAGIGCAVGACVHIRLRDRRGHRPRARAQQLQGGGGGPGQEHVSPTCGRRQRAQWLGARASFGLPEPHL